MSRVERVAQNVKFAAISQLMLVLSNFVVRKVFIMMLGEEYLGLSGLFSDILSMLSLAELGFGTSIVFSLYKPLAEGNTEKIKSLMDLFKKVYQVIGIFVLAAGVSLTPFLGFFVKEMPQDIPYIEWIYILNVVNTGVSYFFIYKASLLFADQKKYVEMIINTVVKLISAALQLLVLLFTRNYILYLCLIICATFLQNVVVSLKVDRMYPFLKDKQIQKLEPEDTAVIKRNVGAMVFHKIGHVAVFSTDSIIMAKFVSVAAVGIYSNYMLIRKALINVIDLFFVSIAASMGNVNACETDEKKYEVYGHVYFLSAWMFGFICICLLCLYTPFITLWLGEEYLLPFSTVFVIVLNFYMYCMRMPVNNTKEAMGLFWNDRFKPIFEVIVNLVVSIVLVRQFGIDGVLWGTLISTVTVPFLVEPYVLYKRGLKKRVSEYYIRYFGYLGITAAAAVITAGLCGLTSSGVEGFLVKMAICAIVPNVIYLVVYHRTKDFQYLQTIFVKLYSKILVRWRGKKCQ